jgi:alanyl-tRNA synthetase
MLSILFRNSMRYSFTKTNLGSKFILRNHLITRRNFMRIPTYTKKIYWHDAYLTQHKAKVIEVGKDSKGPFVRLNETIFHPQGGGQPADEGTINGIKVIKLEESREKITDEKAGYDVGVITHYLEKEPEFKEGEEVSLSIDKEKRLLHSALHTAGHVTAGVMRTKYSHKDQTGANHFPGGQSKVEFKTDGKRFSEAELAEEVNKIIKEGRKVTAEFTDIPETYQRPGWDKKGRCVTIFGLWQEPCSGTHLKSTDQIKEYAVRSKKEKQGKLTVGYDAKFNAEAADKKKDDADAATDAVASLSMTKS